MKVFVSVGTQKFPFDRLLKLAEQAAQAGGPKDQYFAQSGFCNYTPQCITCKPFLQKEEFEQQIQDCDLLIVHGGVGTIITALKYQKKVVVIPRLGKYGEHVDNHQMQIARSFEQKGLVLCYREGDDILALVEKAKTYDFAPYVSHRADMISTIQAYLAGLEKSTGVSAAM